MAICCDLRQKLPSTKILVLAIFPRDEYPTAERAINDEVSLLASLIANDETIFYLDINDNFLEPDGRLPVSMFPDFIHPTAAGYLIWAEAMDPTIRYLMSL